MKKSLMFLICIAILASFSVNAFAEEAPAERTPAEYEYFFSNGEMSGADSKIFNELVVIEGEEGGFYFSNCLFNKGVIFRAHSEGSRVMFDASCEFAEGNVCKIESDIIEATMETNLPKLMFLGSHAETEICGSGAIVSYGDQPILVNGESYELASSTFYVNETTGEAGAYTGQDANLMNYGIWTENGETVTLKTAVYSEF